jgi:arabinofuranosyltransferase
MARESDGSGSIGFFGLAAGPTKFLIDRNALSDPLLARLPVSPRLYFEFYAGHYFRDLPAGYLESCDRGENLLQDPLLHDYYDRLRNVTRGPLFQAARFRDIWNLNWAASETHECESAGIALSVGPTTSAS